MKKLLAILLCALMVAGLFVGCANNDTPAPTEAAPVPPSHVFTVCDSAWDATRNDHKNAGAYNVDFTTNNQGNGFIEAAHSGKGNVGFWDGHVDVLAPTQLAQIGAYSSGTNYAYVLEPAKGGITVLYSNLKRRNELF